MATSRIKAKGRREGGAFVPLPCSLLMHDNFIKLSSKSKGLLFDMLSQLRFKTGGSTNNGDLCVTASMMKERGWNSNESLELAIKELVYYEFILLTRQGGRNLPNLYALTFFAIDECGGKLNIKPTNIPPSQWKISKAKWKRPPRPPRLKKTLPRISPNHTPHNGEQGLKSD